MQSQHAVVGEDIRIFCENHIFREKLRGEFEQQGRASLHQPDRICCALTAAAVGRRRRSNESIEVRQGCDGREERR